MPVEFDILRCSTDGRTSFPCVDCGLLTGDFCDGSGSVGDDRCFAGDRVPEDYANGSGINAHHYVVITKHFRIPADFVLQSQDAHHLPGATTGHKFH